MEDEVQTVAERVCDKNERPSGGEKQWWGEKKVDQLSFKRAREAKDGFTGRPGSGQEETVAGLERQLVAECVLIVLRDL